MNGRQLSIILDVSEATVSRLASGDRLPSLKLMGKIAQARALGWSVNSQAKAIESDTYATEFKTRMERKKAPKAQEVA